MSELSGTAAVGIETVEWLDGGSGNLIVRVTGRWRRRRLASTAQVMLVIESDGRRHRFPAMPEPPSLGGMGPGMWRLSFSVPGSLAPAMGGHIWLALGTVTVPLPAPGVGESGVTEPVAGELATFAHPPPLEEPVADPGIDELVRALDEARADRDRLAAELAERDRTRRIAEQRAHAEQALRQDLARQLAGREREAERAREALGDLAAAEDTIRTLERELADARRRGDEAEQQAAAAVARARAQRAARPNAPRSAREREAARLGFERRLSAHQAETVERVPAEPTNRPAPTPSDPIATQPPPLAPPSPVAVPVPDLVETLRRELDARAAGEAGLRSRLVAAETRLAARVLLDQRTTETLNEVREELGGLTVALERERAGRQAAERRASELERQLGGQRARSRDAYDAIGELRGTLERLATPPPSAEADPVAVGSPAPSAAPVAPGDSAPGPAGPVQVDRLSDALARLRESVAPPEGLSETTAVAVAAGGRTLESAFRRLVKRDADTAGELLMDLLVLQRAAYPHPVAYDLVLGPGRGVVRVTVGEGAPSIERHGAARTREEVDFRVMGAPARIARLLRAHGIWRRLGLRVARVRGRRDGLVALEALLAMPLDLAALRDAGATLRAESALGLVAAMVEPAWTAGERFVIAHRDPAGRLVYLVVRDGRALEVTQTAPPGRIAATIDGPSDALVTVLSGAPSPAAQLSGDEGPIASLRAWITNAQRG